jgi:hypothetical protein
LGTTFEILRRYALIKRNYKTLCGKDAATGFVPAFFLPHNGGTSLIIFSVPLPNKPPVFMAAEVTAYKNGKRGVVIVDAQKFLQLWRNDPYNVHREQAFGNPQTWPKDRKYPGAEKVFSYGYDSPVPLAYVSHRLHTRTIVSYKFLRFGRREHKEQCHYVSFTDGVTRTIWLLSQECNSFPIECEMPGAEELHRVASAPGACFFTVEELLLRT